MIMEILLSAAMGQAPMVRETPRKQDKVTITVLSTTYCPACVRLHHEIDEFCRGKGLDKVVTKYYNVDVQPEKKKLLRGSFVPQLILTKVNSKGKKVVERHTGYKSQSELRSLIAKFRSK